MTLTTWETRMTLSSKTIVTGRGGRMTPGAPRPPWRSSPPLATARPLTCPASTASRWPGRRSTRATHEAWHHEPQPGEVNTRKTTLKAYSNNHSGELLMSEKSELSGLTASLSLKYTFSSLNQQIVPSLVWECIWWLWQSSHVCTTHSDDQAPRLQRSGRLHSYWFGSRSTPRPPLSRNTPTFLHKFKCNKNIL